VCSCLAARRGIPRWALPASQIGLGLPGSSSAADSGYVSRPVVNDARDYLAAQANWGSFVPPAPGRARIRVDFMSADLPFLRPCNGGNTA